MSVTPKDILNKNKNLEKRVKVEDIDLNNVTVDDLTFSGNNYKEHINLLSLLENISACQISDAYNGVSHRPGTIKSIKPINNLKVWGKIYTAETTSDDWGTSALAIDDAGEGDILFFKVDNDDKAIWGELASTCAKNNGVKATAVYGSVRDLDALLDMDYPVFASNFVPNAGMALGLGKLNQPIEVEGTQINPGDFFFGDESGIVVIPKELFTKVMISALGVKLKESAIVEKLADGVTLGQVVGLRKK
ncbi:RraA family protein [Methanobrevibacter sp.]|uniref:RraA family protein n=1 Tax=Methanobrevibacter sp. TaxID=66852 RepID=UPI0025F4D805|nr:RraA family protein [Methanobrevibacter sp.]MBQ6511219.1 RraA family protein [Methanobrevibacter sp.]